MNDTLKTLRGSLWLTIFILGFTPLVGIADDGDAPRVRNVLFIISDDLKASVLGCYGDRVCKTPHIDQLASRSLVFDRAYCQGTSCAPSRTSLMFSRYQGRGQINLGQHFKQSGWYSARVGKIYHMRVPGDIIAGTNGQDIASSWTERFNSAGQEAHTPGAYACLNLNVFTDELAGRQSTRMPHRMFVSVKIQGDGSDQPDHKTATKVIELLEKHKDQPFFIAAGMVRPHYPMVAPEPYFERYPWRQMHLPAAIDDDLNDIPPAGRAGTQNSTNQIGLYPDNQKRMWAAYYASVSFMDDQVGRILQALERLGLHENTAVVFTSDHGYHLGEHGFWQKSNLHEEVLRVPLLISVPDGVRGHTQSIVELVDLYPTLAELCGLKIPGEVQGASLSPILEDPSASVKDTALSFHRSGHSMRLTGWHYMRYRDGSEELYDMKNDPAEFHNLAKHPDRRERIKKMRERLDERLEAVGER